MSRKWWKEAVVYQVYTRSFYDSNGDGIGDINGVIRKLDYLKELGIDVIWLSPVYKSPNDDNGYDISDYEDIMEEFGTMEDFDRLLKETHKRGMKLIMDLVINHTSDEHPWFIESRSSRENPKRDWYIWADGKDGREPNNWESIFGGSVWEYDELTGQYYMHLFSKKQPDLNWENPEVRKGLYRMVNRWLDRGIDGFRVDAISHIKKKPGFPDMPDKEGGRYVECYPYVTNYDGIDEYLQEFADTVLKHHDILTVGEANGVGPRDVGKWVGEENGYFNMIFQFEHLALWNKKYDDSKIDVKALMTILTKWQKTLGEAGWNALFLENHDLPRSVSVLGNDTDYWLESAKMLGALFFFMKGTPFIYQGQEIGMTNVAYERIEEYDDVNMRQFYRIGLEKGRPHEELMYIIQKISRDNARSPMQWEASRFGGFTEGDHTWLGVNPNYKVLNVEKQSGDEHSVLSFYKKMIALRKKEEVFIYGKYEWVEAENPVLAAYSREIAGAKAYIVCNFGSDPIEQSIDVEQAELLLHNYSSIEEKGILRPYEARVYLSRTEE